jgi:probable HAF family extracellular repeat protein
MNPLRHATRLLALGVALSCLIAPRAGHAQCDHRRFTSIDVPGAPNTVVTGLNNFGQVVGSYLSGDVTKSFVWSGGRFTNLVTSASVQTTTPSAINDLDQIVGLQVSSTSGQSGFFFDRGRFTSFNDPNSIFGLTFPQSINDLGEVAGFFVDANSSTSGFVYRRGVFTTVKVPFTGAVTTAINAINNEGQIAGYYVASNPDGSFTTQAYVSVKGGFLPPSVPGATGYSVATGINDLGQVVGYYIGSDNTTHGFLYDRGHYTSVDAPVTGAQGTYPGGINDLGQISGEYVDSTLRTHGFFLSGGDD